MGDRGPWGKAKPRNSINDWVLVAAMGGAAVGNYLWSNSSNLVTAVSSFGANTGCNIKGNISITGPAAARPRQKRQLRFPKTQQSRIDGRSSFLMHGCQGSPYRKER